MKNIKQLLKVQSSSNEKFLFVAGNFFLMKIKVYCNLNNKYLLITIMLLVKKGERYKLNYIFENTL